MFTLDDLEVISTATVPGNVYREMQNTARDKEALVYVGVDGNNFHCYMRYDGSYLRLKERIENDA